jgi:hypothetical protein
MRLASIILLSSWLLQSLIEAFPPAPYYTLHGFVRDQVGQTLEVDGAEIILLKGEVEIGRAQINSSVRLEQNYELRIRIDHNRSGTTPYSDKAVAAQGPFSLAVDMNGSRFYPIEVRGDLTAGKGGEHVRLDLNLGEDLDGDGLPDIWEAWQLYQAGHYADANGNWPLHLLSRHGDLDGDGISDWLEYVAGTFAGDATERFELQIKEKLPTSVRFEFFGIAGKTYTIERSTDVKTWVQVPFSVGIPSGGVPTFRASEIGIHTAFAAPEIGGASSFYRLTVR